MIPEFEKFRADVETLRNKLVDVGEGLHIHLMEEELEDLHEEQGAPGFWDNLERSTHVTRRISHLENKIKHYNELVSSCDDIDVMMELAEEDQRVCAITAAMPGGTGLLKFRDKQEAPD